MEALVIANLRKRQDGGVLEVDTNNQPVFGFGNSSRDKCLSATKMRISANNKDGALTIHNHPHLRPGGRTSTVVHLRKT